jgi:hypothetical protein
MLTATEFMIAPTDLQGNNPRPDLRPHVVQNSWGGLAGGGPTGQLLFYALLERQRAAGVFPSFSASNDGPSCGTVRAPGDNPFTFNIAATTNTDGLASFSSRGPSPYGGISPQVAAPGVGIRSSLPGNTYGTLSGTSMAGPHNAGAVALLVSVEPKLAGQIEQIEELLRRTARPLTNNQTCGGVPGSQVPNNAFGWGRINVKAAADMVWQAGWLRGRVTNASNQGLAGITVSVSRQIVTQTYTLTTQTDPQGYYSFILGQGTYNTEASGWGYTAQSANGVAVTQNNTTTQNFTLAAAPVYAEQRAVWRGHRAQRAARQGDGPPDGVQRCVNRRVQPGAAAGHARAQGDQPELHDAGRDGDGERRALAGLQFESDPRLRVRRQPPGGRAGVRVD